MPQLYSSQVQGISFGPDVFHAIGAGVQNLYDAPVSNLGALGSDLDTNLLCGQGSAHHYHFALRQTRNAVAAMSYPVNLYFCKG